MKRHRLAHVWITGLLLASVTLAATAPAAEAKGKQSQRHKTHSASVHRAPGDRWVYRSPRRHHAPPRVVEIRRSSELPALAGFLGGLVVGAVISHAASAHDDVAPAPAYYYYYDPYCRVSFASLEAYQSHLARHGHPGIVRVIDSDSGVCVHVYRFHAGAWEDWDDDGE